MGNFFPIEYAKILLDLLCHVCGVLLFLYPFCCLFVLFDSSTIMLVYPTLFSQKNEGRANLNTRS